MLSRNEMLLKVLPRSIPAAVRLQMQAVGGELERAAIVRGNRACDRSMLLLDRWREVAEEQRSHVRSAWSVPIAFGGVCSS